MRRFRDGYLLSTVQGRQLVERYYKTAPAIAERLYSSADLQAVWDVISSCVTLIENDEHAQAVAEYQVMFLALERRFA